ncbi:phosphate acetyltransferase [Nocardioides agariphilus]|jgi:phosphate acetyltransferase|uniref:Phosphate acetyltransferase n=1 Tax=Nocardioides agariphilus TaxID=433664 RepID=A0A930VG94_9ACTN|nr:phosphate acetyltransferase [Nocardioides agariphilus]MBF4766969.1 phosphate acetyltransferase [Nocardioides agariphilus]
MATSVYVAAVEGFTGKSTVALGVLEQLSRRVERVAVFRPVVRGDAATDYVLDLLVSHEAVHLTYDECAGVTYAELHRDPEAALDRIVERFHQVAEQADAVVVVGSDYTDVGAPTEFSFNAKIAANLASPVLLVLNAHHRTPEEVRTAADLALTELRGNHGTLFAVVANRADAEDLDGVVKGLEGIGAPAFALPEEPLLSAPSMADLMRSCHGHLVHGEESLLTQETTGILVAAMTLPHVLDRLFDGAVVVTPGDRPEVVLGVLTAQVSANFPQMAGIVLNGGFELPEQVTRLIDGLGTTMPIVATSMDTSETTRALTSVRGRLQKDSPRKVATALRIFEERVDGDVLLDRLEVARTTAVTPLMFEHQLIDMAVADRRHIVLPEGDDDRILQAADIVLRRRIAELTILGEAQAIRQRAALLGVDISAARLLSPTDPELRGRFAAAYHQRRKHKGIDLERARDIVIDVSYFGTMMVELGLADGMVSGAAHTTAHTIRPALEVVRTAPDVSVVSSVFFMCLRDQVLVYGDCAVNPDPTAAQLADIALASSRTAAAFGIEPRVAMLSYSTGGSGAGSDVDKVIEATAMVRERAPSLLVEGPIQYDAAIDAAVARTKLPGSQVAGRATVFVFPDLNTGNNTYKAVQRSAGALAVGPILQGLNKPVNDLSRGASVRDIVNTVAITAIQAQASDQRR